MSRDPFAERRQRARAHLERVRARRERRAGRSARSGDRGRDGRAAAALGGAVFALAFALGAVAAGPLGSRLAGLAGGREAPLASIAVQGAERLTPEEVARATGLAPGAAAAEVVPDQVAARLRTHPWVAEARAVRLPSGRLVVGVEEREPRAVLAVEPAGSAPSAWWVDEEGRPYAPVDDAAAEATALPRLLADAALAPGESHAVLREALALAARARPAALRLPRAGSDDGWVLVPRGAAFEVLLGREHLEERLARLEELLATEAVVETARAQVDLRFADQAVLR